jgi:transposase-like protein
MLKTGKRLKHRRLFSEEFKLRVVNCYESGQHTVLEMARDYNLSPQSIYTWIYEYSEYNKKSIQVVEMKDSQQQKIKALEEKVKELEQAVGRKQINIDYLEKMIELAKEQYQIDIKKNFDTPHSGGSKKTDIE